LVEHLAKLQADGLLPKARFMHVGAAWTPALGFTVGLIDHLFFSATSVQRRIRWRGRVLAHNEKIPTGFQTGSDIS
jgi:hypothetical protein